MCTRVVVTAETEHGERTERAWYRAAGLSAPAMVERLRWQLDAWMTSGEVSAGVVLLRWRPTEVRGDDGDQVRLWGGPSAADERATRAVARLAGMVGDQGVLVPAWRGGRLPGDRYGWVPASTTDLTDPARPAVRRVPGHGRAVAGTVAGDRAPRRATPSCSMRGRPVAVSGRGELRAAPATLVVGGAARRAAIVGRAVAARRAVVGAAAHRRLARFQVVTDDGAAHLVLAEQQPGGWSRRTGEVAER